jgi:hypothetical protein
MFLRKLDTGCAGAKVRLPLLSLLSLLTMSGCGGGDAPSTTPPSPLQTQVQDAQAVSAGRNAMSRPVPRTPVDSTGVKIPPVIDEGIQLAATTTPLVTGTINSAPNWPVWYGNGKPVDGVGCLVSGAYHRHALISIYSNGRRLGLPDGIGRVHAGCYHAYEMHVHDVTGIIHIEADVPKQFKLGQWFSLWQQPLSRDNVGGLAGPARFYVIDNKTLTRYDGDPTQISIMPHREIVIITGSPMTVLPKYEWPLGI